MSAPDWISLLLLIVTGVYVYLTWQIANSNRELLKQTQRAFIEERSPYIVAYPTVEQSVLICLEIKNIGRSSAKNLTLSMDKDFYIFGENKESRNIRNFNAFQQIIPQFAPGEILRFNLSQGFNLENEFEGRNLTPKEFEIIAKYSYEGEKRQTVHPIDLKPLFGNSVAKTIAEKLGDIEQAIEKWKHV